MNKMARYSKNINKHIDVMRFAPGDEHHGVMLPRMSPVFGHVSTEQGDDATM